MGTEVDCRREKLQKLVKQEVEEQNEDINKFFEEAGFMGYDQVSSDEEEVIETPK